MAKENYRVVTDYCKYLEIVKNELYTEKELIKLGLSTSLFKVVDVSRKKTHWFFGARFVDEDADIKECK